MDEKQFQQGLKGVATTKENSLLLSLIVAVEKLTEKVRDYLQAEGELSLYGHFEQEFSLYGASIDSQAEQNKREAEKKVRSAAQRASASLASAKALRDRLFEQDAFLKNLF